MARSKKNLVNKGYSPPLKVEEYRAQVSGWVEQIKHSNTTRVEMFKSVIATGQTAINSAILINGGASVATLALIGNVVNEQTTIAGKLACALTMFAYGVLSPVVAAGTTYFAQFLYSYQKTMSGRIFHGISICLVIASYVLFCLGIFSARKAFPFN